MRGYLVNDYLTTIPGTKTLWHHLLSWIPGLESVCGHGYGVLADAVECLEPPDYVIRNAAYFRPLSWDAPTIAYVQDPLTGRLREQLVGVCKAATRVIYNSEWTRSYYKSGLSGVDGVVIPIGVNFDLFKPSFPQEDYIVFIGSCDAIKGLDDIRPLIERYPKRFVLIMKDKDPKIPGTEVIIRADEQAVADILSKARLLLCPSRMETQHLAGCEAGASGVPIIATPVGVYSGLAPGDWGTAVYIDDFAGEVDRELQRILTPERRADIRAFWREKVSLPACRKAWMEQVKFLLGA